MSDYLMPKTNGVHEVIIDKSRFICHVRRVTSIEEANKYIDEIKKEHAKANHNCVAYQIGPQNEIQRAFDDGEPTGTAGIPMLDVLRRQDIRNCLIVVTRYFGGIKLGAGGLIRAYGNVTSAGIKAVGLVRRFKLQRLHLSCDYPLFDRLQSKIKNKGGVIHDVQYSDRIKMEVLVEVAEVETFIDWMVDMTNRNVVPVVGDYIYQEVLV